jgi:hypothetical protein
MASPRTGAGDAAAQKTVCAGYLSAADKHAYPSGCCMRKGCLCYVQLGRARVQSVQAMHAARTCLMDLLDAGRHPSPLSRVQQSAGFAVHIFSHLAAYCLQCTAKTTRTAWRLC